MTIKKNGGLIMICNNLVEYVYKDNCTSNIPDVFNEINLSYKEYVPDNKPDIESIVKVVSNVKINDYFLIKTPVSTSLEGQILTGWKLSVEGTLYTSVQYVAKDVTQSVHNMEFCKNFSNYIVLPDDFNAGSTIYVKGCINNIYTLNKNPRYIYNNATLTIYVDIY